MTYVYLNYENMKKVTTSLAGYADKAEQARSDALTANSNNKNPGVLENMPTMAEKVHQLRDKTKEIDDRVELAKTQSENGATPKDSRGSIAYYVPDNMEDNIDNARSANQAIEDAKSLKEKKADQARVRCWIKLGNTTITTRTQQLSWNTMARERL